MIWPEEIYPEKESNRAKGVRLRPLHQNRPRDHPRLKMRPNQEGRIEGEKGRPCRSIREGTAHARPDDNFARQNPSAQCARLNRKSERTDRTGRSGKHAFSLGQISRPFDDLADQTARSKRNPSTIGQTFLGQGKSTFSIDSNRF
ncbi:unnamed protein product [Microthlaspi erraticum]|uniref:Uncharacterized protein n=1 Tax=Microthlaspi erraticum TaxID=1685480 RepID=A0A6D2J202_9BRAS|nr:unnamed protein product [Microthlaspi erraticum]